MTRITSIETYNEIKNSGLLSKMRQVTYDLVYKHQPLSSLEILKIAGNKDKNSSTYLSRVTELHQMGLVYEHSIGECPISGRTVTFWGTTDNLPEKFIPPPSKKEKKKLTRESINKTYRYIANKHGKDNELINHFKEVVRNLESI